MMSLERAKRIIQAAPKADNELIEAHLVVFADKLLRGEVHVAGWNAQTRTAHGVNNGDYDAQATY